jgi:hypothetical protein
VPKRQTSTAARAMRLSGKLSNQSARGRHPSQLAAGYRPRVEERLTTVRRVPQPDHARALWRRRQRPPAGDGPGAFPRAGVVGDARKPSAQLDGGRQLAFPLEDVADGSCIGFGEDEHGLTMGPRSVTGKAAPRRAICHGLA